MLDPTGQEGEKGVIVDLNPGDMLIYRGCDLSTGENHLKVMTVVKCSCIITMQTDLLVRKI